MTPPVPLTSETAMQLSRAWAYHAHKIDLFLAHSRDELRIIDGFPTGEEGGSSRDTVYGDPAGSAALARYHLCADREQIRDDLATIVELSNSLFCVLDHGLRTRAPSPAAEVGACATPGCQSWATRHTTATGAVITDRCDDCWSTLRCQVCGTRDRAGRKVGGYPACEACAKADQRARIKDVA